MSRVQPLLERDEPITASIDEYVIADEMHNELLDEMEKLSSTTGTVNKLNKDYYESN